MTRRNALRALLWAAATLLGLVPKQVGTGQHRAVQEPLPEVGSQDWTEQLEACIEECLVVVGEVPR